MRSRAQRPSERFPWSWRARTWHLHLVDALGGWAGALVAQQQFRHKTIKQPFQAIFWVTVAINLAGAGWLLHSGMAPGTASGMGWPSGA